MLNEISKVYSSYSKNVIVSYSKSASLGQNNFNSKLFIISVINVEILYLKSVYKI